MLVTMLARGGKWLEVLVLALGLGAGATMVWAGLQLGGRGDWTGRFELDRLAADLTERTAAAWTAFRDEGGAWAAAGERWVLDAALLARALEPATAPVPFADATAFDALLAEARRQEQRGSAREQVAGLLDSAAGLGPPPDRAARLELRRLQLTLGAGDLPAARAAWAKLWSPSPGAPAPAGLDGDLPPVLLGALAILPWLEPDEAAATARELLAALESGGVRLDPSDLPPVDPAAVPTVGRAALVVEALAQAAGLDDEPARTLAALAELGRHRAVAAELGLATASPVDVRRLTGGDLLLARRTADRIELLRATPVALVAAFRASLADRVTLGPDLSLVLAGDAAGLAPDSLLGPPIELGMAVERAVTDVPGEPAEPSATGPTLRLHHADVAGFVSAESARQDSLRAAFLFLGGVTALAAALAALALRRQRRLAELKTEFIAKVSHELRTPVTGILLASEGLDEERAPSPERRARYVGLIQKEARRLERLVANVLDFSRLDRGAPGTDWLRPEPMAASRCADELVSRATERFGADGFELARDELPADARVAADLEALGRAVGNLLENAHSHGGAPRPRLELVWDAGLRVAVEDDGPGVDATERAGIFAPFAQGARTAGAGGGAGLGLSIVRELVAAHGGRVSLQPAASGRYARFELTLPAADLSGSDFAPSPPDGLADANR